MSCYKFELLRYHQGLLNNIVDATYVIHLEGNGRLTHVRKQLDIFQPSDITYILHNKGFKKCHKDLPEQISYADLVDAFLQVFEHAREHNYDNILVLEDDFIFSNQILDLQVRERIRKFVESHKGQSFVYMLGILPFILTPYDDYHYHVYGSIGAHACIYSPEVRKEIMNNRKNIQDWDFNLFLNCHKYCYYVPLCYQLIGATENRSNWFHTYGIKYVLIYIVEALNIHQNPEPGYTIFYYGAKSFIYVLILIIIILLFRYWKSD